MALRPIYHVGIIAIALALAACSSAAPSRGERPGSPTVGAQVGHIHAVDLNPTDGSVFAATHHGVFRIDPRGGPVQVIGRAQDMRGFTVTDDDRILSSGHPDSPEAGPTDLGLIVSNDGARTWTSVSLSGEADFHALSAVGATVYGFDVVTGRVMRSDDNGQHWQRGATLDATRVDVDPTDPLRVLATTRDGLRESIDGGVSFNLLQPQPAAAARPGRPHHLHVRHRPRSRCRRGGCLGRGVVAERRGMGGIRRAARCAHSVHRDRARPLSRRHRRGGPQLRGRGPLVADPHLTCEHTRRPSAAENRRHRTGGHAEHE